MTARIVVIIFMLVVTGCISVVTDPRLRSVDQLPMYGGMDRALVPELKKADEAFIEGTSSAFGGRERAAKLWVEKAFAFYHRGDLDTAMRRFNQAWLLDPNNPEVYWGFGAVMHDRGMAFGAYDMEIRAYNLGFRDPGFLADLGRVAALRTVEAKDLSPAKRAAFLAESEAFYEEAAKSGDKLAYVYKSWSHTKYLVGDYAAAWVKVKAARATGATADASFLAMLAKQMPEPK